MQQYVELIPMNGTVIGAQPIKGQKREFVHAKLENNGTVYSVIAFSPAVYNKFTPGAKLKLLATIKPYIKNGKDYISIIAVKAEAEAKHTVPSDYDTEILDIVKTETETGVTLFFSANGRLRQASADAGMLKGIQKGDKVSLSLKKSWQKLPEGRKALYTITEIKAV